MNSHKRNNEKTQEEEDKDNLITRAAGMENGLEDFTKDGFKTLVEAIRHSNALPTGGDWRFYKTDEAFTRIINSESQNIEKLINLILRKNEMHGNIKNVTLDRATELIIEANDNILEKVGTNIDELNGIKKESTLPILPQVVTAELPLNGSWNRINNATFSVSTSLVTGNQQSLKSNSIRLLTAKNILRPQKFFKDTICNSSEYPWEPRIKDKPNSLKPLAIFLEETSRGEEFSHPYEYELERFVPGAQCLARDTPVPPKPISETELIEVSSVEQLDQLLDDLRKCEVIGVDLEHHSYRSFMGITCLMQISTTDTDYLIDTLALRDRLHVLNEVFTKPSIVKVFHGADMDVQWLQRDLSLYIVNMFDTYQAAKILGYSGLSFAYLLNRFCNFVPNKQFQLADWRMRPLPDELKAYAREDSHYLMYIYQKLKIELLDKANGHDNLLKSVFQRSTETCLKRYFKPVLRNDSYMDFYRKCKRLFDNRQLYALKELYKWRDQLSREEDESTGYVLPNHMLLQISEALPREMQGILACCNPVPPLIKANLLTIHQIILTARDQSLNKPILQEDTRAQGQTRKISKINMDSPLNCPHDLTKTNEFRDDLNTLLVQKVSLENLIERFKQLIEGEQEDSTYSVFNRLDFKCAPDNRLTAIKFLGPYQRYTLVKPFVQAEEEKLASEQQQTEEVADNLTDEQRVEAIHEHFLNLSKNTIMQPQETEQAADWQSDYFTEPMKKRKSSDGQTSPNKDFKPNPAWTPKQNNNKRRRNRQAKKPPQVNPQNNRKTDEFSAYDYASVDYRQFQGGAGGAPTRKDVKSNFRSKGRKKRFNRGQTHGGKQ